MATSTAELRGFFSFDDALQGESAIEFSSRISKIYFRESKPQVFIKTLDESFTNLDLSEAVEKLNSNEIELLQITLAENGLMFHLIFQFINEKIGKNGNYAILLGSKKANADVKKQLYDKLPLGDYSMDNMILGDNEMRVNPIFKTKRNDVNEKFCFVLMPFLDELKPVYEDHIKPTLVSLGFSCERADSIFDNKPVMESIWENILKARIVIADLTGKNPNVFYEIGICHTLGK